MFTTIQRFPSIVALCGSRDDAGSLAVRGLNLSCQLDLGDGSCLYMETLIL